MKPLRYRVKSVDGVIDAEIERAGLPAICSTITVFDYPVVTHYVVERYEPLNDRVLIMDQVEPEKLIVARKTVVAESKRAARSIGRGGATGFLARLDLIERLANQYIPFQRCLKMCYADFAAMCAESGLAVDLSACDITAFRGTPLMVGGEGAEANMSTAFEGFNDDLCVLYVTLPGGMPFVMDPAVLDIAKEVVRGTVDEQRGVTAISRHARSLGVEVTSDRTERICNTLQLAIDGTLPPYDAAQDLIRILHCAPNDFPDAELRMMLAPSSEANAAPMLEIWAQAHHSP